MGKLGINNKTTNIDLLDTLYAGIAGEPHTSDKIDNNSFVADESKLCQESAFSPHHVNNSFRSPIHLFCILTPFQQNENVKIFSRRDRDKERKREREKERDR